MPFFYRYHHLYNPHLRPPLLYPLWLVIPEILLTFCHLCDIWSHKHEVAMLQPPYGKCMQLNCVSLEKYLCKSPFWTAHPYFRQMLWDWINLPCVLMVSRHLSVKHDSLLWECTLNLHRGHWPVLQAHTKPGWIHASLFNSPWPRFHESGPVLFIGAPGTILFGSAGNIQGAREGKGTFVELCWNESLGLWCPELCQSTFSLLPQTEIIF